MKLWCLNWSTLHGIVDQFKHHNFMTRWTIGPLKQCSVPALFLTRWVIDKL